MGCVSQRYNRAENQRRRCGERPRGEKLDLSFLPTLVIIVILLLVVSFVISRVFRTEMKCNRCQGTGEVNEHWPDPTEPSGFHHVEGVCPKCKGRGKVPVK